MPPEIELIDDDLDNDVATVDEPTSTEAEDRGDVVSTETTEPTDEESQEPSAKGAARIPKARFDEVNTKRQEAERELAEAQAEIARLKAAPVAEATEAPVSEPVVLPAEVKELRKQYHQALMDGDTDQAEALSEAIDAKVIQIAEQNLEQRQLQKQTATSLQAESSKALEDYPYLDTPDGEEALNAILAARDRRIANGMNPAQALRESVAAIAPKFAPDGFIPNKRLEDDGQRTDTRTANAIARGARDSNAQPPAMLAGQGNRTTEARSQDPTKMTDAQFEQLSDAEKRKLRGD